MTDGAGIQLCAVTVRHGRTVALDAVDLEVPRGTVYALLGSNGAGKTTVARAIAGLVLPTAGDVRIAGTSVRSSGIHRVRQSLGFLPQEPLLYEELTGTEFLRFVRDLYGVGPSEETRRRSWLARMEVKGWIDAPIRTYSVGMRKKVALLASLVSDPTFWILDEPFAALDEAGARFVEDEVERLRADRGSILFTTHDLDAAKGLADRVGVLDHGRKVFEGPPASFCAVRHG